MWVVAQTKPRQENKAKINLNNQGYTCYLPIIERKKFLRDNWVTFKEVLFSNYIFIDLNSSKTSLFSSSSLSLVIVLNLFVGVVVFPQCIKN